MSIPIRKQDLFEKIRTLPEDRVSEVEDFVDFIRQRDEDRRLSQAVTQLSEPALRKSGTILTTPSMTSYSFGDVVVSPSPSHAAELTKVQEHLETFLGGGGTGPGAGPDSRRASSPAPTGGASGVEPPDGEQALAPGRREPTGRRNPSARRPWRRSQPSFRETLKEWHRPPD